MENQNMEIVNETTQVSGGSKGGKVAGLVLGTLGVLGGIAAAVIYKKKKNQKVEEEFVEENPEVVEEN